MFIYEVVSLIFHQPQSSGKNTEHTHYNVADRRTYKRFYSTRYIYPALLGSQRKCKINSDWKFYMTLKVN